MESKSFEPLCFSPNSFHLFLSAIKMQGTCNCSIYSFKKPNSSIVEIFFRSTSSKTNTNFFPLDSSPCKNSSLKNSKEFFAFFSFAEEKLFFFVLSTRSATNDLALGK